MTSTVAFVCATIILGGGAQGKPLEVLGKSGGAMGQRWEFGGKASGGQRLSTTTGCAPPVNGSILILSLAKSCWPEIIR